MRNSASPSLRLLLPILALLLALPACTFKGTTKGSTDMTSDVTATTSGKTWFTEDGLVKDDQRVNAFANLNFENLRQDAARGHGEYLSALGSLLGVPRGHEEEFFTLMREHYPLLFGVGPTTPDRMLATLNQTLATRPSWQRVAATP